MKLDFPKLYSQLGLTPDCSLDEFKHAYRRRVSELHPDRHHADTMGDTHPQQLMELISLYKQALRFQELHGRLPGSQADPAPPAPRPSSRAETPLQPEETEGKTSPPRRLWLVLALVAFAGWFVSNASNDNQPPSSSNSAEEARQEQPSPTRHADRLERGVDRAMVLSIHGPPSRQDGDVWEYGPSWIRFDSEGKVVEWYSSPLYRLKLRDARPSY